MNDALRNAVIELLNSWIKLLALSKKKSLRGAKKLRDGDKYIIWESDSKPITFDYDCLAKQKMIQKK